MKTHMRMFTVIYRAGKNNPMGIPEGEYGMREYMVTNSKDALAEFRLSEMHKNDIAVTAVDTPFYNVVIAARVANQA